jgi:Flp pilus assembly protein TadD
MARFVIVRLGVSPPALASAQRQHPPVAAHGGAGPLGCFLAQRLTGTDLVLDVAAGDGALTKVAARHAAAVFVVGVAPAVLQRWGQEVAALGPAAPILPAPVTDVPSLRTFLADLPAEARLVVLAAPPQLPELLLGLAPCAARGQLVAMGLPPHDPGRHSGESAALVLDALGLTPCALTLEDGLVRATPVAAVGHTPGTGEGALVALPSAVVGRGAATMQSPVGTPSMPAPPDDGDPAKAAEAALARLEADRRLGRLATAREAALALFHAGGWEARGRAQRLGVALMELGAAEPACRCFRQQLVQAPGDPTATALLAGALLNLGHPEEGWALLRPLVDTPPRGTRVAPSLLLAASMVRRAHGDADGALRWVHQLERRGTGDGGDWRATLERAFTQMLRGDYQRGWEGYEARPTPAAPNAARRWRGGALHGTLFVQGEQGIGDLMQFVRFVPALHAAGAARVLVEAAPETVPLLAVNDIEAVPRGLHPRADWYVPLMSIPQALHIGSAVGGERVPYLHAPDPMPPIPLPPAPPGIRRLGLVWAGNPLFPATATRDFDPACLPAVAEIPGVEWVVLQHGAAAHHAPASMHRPALPATWAGTAQWLAQLDGLVTIDTGIAHLAGAMGRPTWLLLPHVAEWRWGLSGDRTPWYPTMRLLRQAQWRDWASVVPMLAEALATPSPLPAAAGR